MADYTLSVNIIARVRGLVKGLDITTKKLRNFTTQVEYFSNKMNRAFLVAAGGIAFMTKEFVKFEDALRDVQKITGASEAEIEKLGKRFIEMSRHTTSTVNQLLKIGFAAAQLGIAKNEIGDFVAAIDKITIATAFTAESAGQDIARLVNIFHLPTSAAERMGDVLDRLENTTTALAPVVATLNKRFGGTARIMGLTFDQVSAISATLVDMGVAYEVGGTAMERFFISMTNRSEVFAESIAGGKQRMDQMIESGRAIDVFTEWLDAFKKMDRTAKVATLKKLRLSSIRLQGTLLKLAQGTQKLDKNLKNANNAWTVGGVLAKEVNIKFRSLSSSMKKLGNNIRASVILAFSEFGGTIKTITDAMTYLINNFRWLTERSIGLATGMAALIIIVKILAIAVTTLTTSWAALQTISGGYTAFILRFTTAASAAEVATYAWSVSIQSLAASYGRLKVAGLALGAILAGAAIGTAIGTFLRWFWNVDQATSKFIKGNASASESIIALSSTLGYVAVLRAQATKSTEDQLAAQKRLLDSFDPAQLKKYNAARKAGLSIEKASGVAINALAEYRFILLQLNNRQLKNSEEVTSRILELEKEIGIKDPWFKKSLLAKKYQAILAKFPKLEEDYLKVSERLKEEALIKEQGQVGKTFKDSVDGYKEDLSTLNVFLIAKRAAIQESEALIEAKQKQLAGKSGDPTSEFAKVLRGEIDSELIQIDSNTKLIEEALDNITKAHESQKNKLVAILKDRNEELAQANEDRVDDIRKTTKKSISLFQKEISELEKQISKIESLREKASKKTDDFIKKQERAQLKQRSPGLAADADFFDTFAEEAAGVDTEEKKQKLIEAGKFAYKERIKDLKELNTEDKKGNELLKEKNALQKELNRSLPKRDNSGNFGRQFDKPKTPAADWQKINDIKGKIKKIDEEILENAVEQSKYSEAGPALAEAVASSGPRIEAIAEAAFKKNKAQAKELENLEAKKLTFENKILDLKIGQAKAIEDSNKLLKDELAITKELAKAWAEIAIAKAGDLKEEQSFVDPAVLDSYDAFKELGVAMKESADAVKDAAAIFAGVAGEFNKSAKESEGLPHKTQIDANDFFSIGSSLTDKKTSPEAPIITPEPSTGTAAANQSTVASVEAAISNVQESEKKLSEDPGLKSLLDTVGATKDSISNFVTNVLNVSFDKINESITSLGNTIVGAFETVDTKLGLLNTAITNIDTRVKTVETTLSELEIQASSSSSL